MFDAGGAIGSQDLVGDTIGEYALITHGFSSATSTINDSCATHHSAFYLAVGILPRESNLTMHAALHPKDCLYPAVICRPTLNIPGLNSSRK